MKILDLKEAAAKLRMHHETLRRLASHGLVPCKRLGIGQKPRYRFVEEQLEQLLLDPLPFQDPRQITQQRHRKEVGNGLRQAKGA